MQGARARSAHGRAAHEGHRADVDTSRLTVAELLGHEHRWVRAVGYQKAVADLRSDDSGRTCAALGRFAVAAADESAEATREAALAFCTALLAQEGTGESVRDAVVFKLLGAAPWGRSKEAVHGVLESAVRAGGAAKLIASAAHLLRGRTPKVKREIAQAVSHLVSAFGGVAFRFTTIADFAIKVLPDKDAGVKKAGEQVYAHIRAIYGPVIDRILHTKMGWAAVESMRELAAQADRQPPTRAVRDDPGSLQGIIAPEDQSIIASIERWTPLLTKLHHTTWPERCNAYLAVGRLCEDNATQPVPGVVAALARALPYGLKRGSKRATEGARQQVTGFCKALRAVLATPGCNSQGLLPCVSPLIELMAGECDPPVSAAVSATVDVFIQRCGIAALFPHLSKALCAADAAPKRHDLIAKIKSGLGRLAHAESLPAEAQRLVVPYAFAFVVNKHPDIRHLGRWIVRMLAHCASELLAHVHRFPEQRRRVIRPIIDRILMDTLAGPLRGTPEAGAAAGAGDGAGAAPHIRRRRALPASPPPKRRRINLGAAIADATASPTPSDLFHAAVRAHGGWAQP
eukprot:TRINITY_DN1444_c0_g3_i1.p1 TRINITY_DN1444_c0_g3~~TRINITY_DN1444_c0_g3_i1.p1  ORF type:complete len:598 (+),score=125.84 TRINITY_DN1444_c0_g3_i1:77-1795(+)